MIKHFVFTNFGIGILDTRWILYRFELFKETVFKSLSAQNNKNFTWIIFVDKNIDFLFKDKLNHLVSQSGCCIEVKEVEAYAAVGGEVADIIGELSPDYCLITTRIDDDDIISYDAINEIQLLAKKHLNDYCLCSFERGYEYLVADGIGREVTYETLALGLSIIVPPGRKKISVTSFAHHLIEDTLKRQGIKFLKKSLCEGRPSWLYVKHQISDSVYFGARARILADPKKKGVDEIGLDGFCVSRDDLIHLKEIMLDAPLGVPFKYLEKFSFVKNGRLPGYFGRVYSRFATRDNPIKALRAGKIRVAIIGSCVSRDLFDVESCLGQKFEIVFYSARSSVISYCSLPMMDEKIVVSGGGFEDLRAQYDINKTHWEKLKESCPDVVLIDFIDERIGIVKHSGSCFSASGPVVKAFERGGVEFDITRPWDSSLVNARSYSLRIFLERVRDVCQNIIIHKARWCSEYLDENNNVKSFGDTKWVRLIELNNNILNKMYDESDSYWVPFDLIEVSSELNRAGGNHKWDLSPFHYDFSYYKQLAKLFVNRISVDL